jgi:hypothetical protein
MAAKSLVVVLLDNGHVATIVRGCCRQEDHSRPALAGGRHPVSGRRPRRESLPSTTSPLRPRAGTRTQLARAPAYPPFPRSAHPIAHLVQPTRRKGRTWRTRHSLNGLRDQVKWIRSHSTDMPGRPLKVAARVRIPLGLLESSSSVGSSPQRCGDGGRLACPRPYGAGLGARVWIGTGSPRGRIEVMAARPRRGRRE